MMQEDKPKDTAPLQTDVVQSSHSNAVENSTLQAQHHSNLRGRWKRTRGKENIQKTTAINSPKEIPSNGIKCACNKTRCEQKTFPSRSEGNCNCFQKRAKNRETSFGKSACENTKKENQSCCCFGKIKHFFCKMFGKHDAPKENEINYQERSSKQHYRGKRPHYSRSSKHSHRRDQD